MHDVSTVLLRHALNPFFRYFAANFVFMIGTHINCLIVLLGKEFKVVLQILLTLKSKLLLPLIASKSSS